MLQRTPEFGDHETPLVSICIVSDRHRCPPNFFPILKAYDDNGDAELWKDGFGFGIFNRVVRYIAVSRIVPDIGQHEVITDLAIISDKEAVPTNFVCIDFTADTKDRALRKKYLCVRFTQRNDAIDALTDVIILNKSKRPPKGFVSAGEVDGTLVCFKVATIPQTYGIKQKPPVASQITNLYPSLNATPIDYSENFSSTLTLKSPFGTHCGLDGVPFKLNPRFEAKHAKSSPTNTIGDPLLNTDLSTFEYNFRLEKSIIAQR